MADDDLNRPYIGYRSAGRRPESQQDRRASADAPLAALRGFLSGVAGAPGDLESLVRMLPGLSERTILPTSEDVERRLPLRSVSETPVGRVATTGGQLAGGFYNGPGSPLRAVAALPSAVSRAGREFLQSNVPVHVVKPKGGNWLTGSVEEAIKPLKRGRNEFSEPYTQADFDNLSARIDEARSRPGYSPYLLELGEQELAEMGPKVALNRWLDTKLAKYMRNEMGTPEDPVRALAERGVLHYDPGALPRQMEKVWGKREELGYPGAMGTSPLAQRWEAYTDQIINAPKAETYQNFGSSNMSGQPGWEWINRVDPESRVYGIKTPSPYLLGEEGMPSLGFSHLVDELRNALNPESGLPANLLLTPEQLGRVSTPQAVELVHKINQYRAAEKAAADLARATGPATHLFKEYPEAGYKWVELKARGPKATSIEGAKSDQELIRKELEDALKYEGDTMGHCVGGYCPDVMEGRSRIFSLRSAKGEPHVTIEVAPSRESAYDYWTQTKGLGPESDEFDQWVAANKGNLPKGGYDAWYRRWAEETGRPIEMPPPSIVQIKGKQNRAPNEKYLPFVQDFVRSQKWGRVGDLHNTGLLDPRQMITEEDLNTLSGMGRELPNYLTEEEYADVLKSLQNNAQGFASGGLVTYNPAEVERLTAPLRAELGLQ